MLNSVCNLPRHIAINIIPEASWLGRLTFATSTPWFRNVHLGVFCIPFLNSNPVRLAFRWRSIALPLYNYIPLCYMAFSNVRKPVIQLLQLFFSQPAKYLCFKFTYSIKLWVNQCANLYPHSFQWDGRTLNLEKEVIPILYPSPQILTILKPFVLHSSNWPWLAVRIDGDQ